MAKNNDGGEGSSSSPAEKVEKRLQDILSELTEYAGKFGKDMEELTKKKDKSDLDLNKSAAEKDLENFMNNLAELVDVITKPHNRESVIADVQAMEDEKEGAEDEVLSTIETLIESFKKYAKEWENAKVARVAKYTSEMEWVEYTVDAMLDRLAEVAQQVIELKEYKSP